MSVISRIFGGGERREEPTVLTETVGATEEDRREERRRRLAATGHTGTIRTGPGGLTASATPTGVKSLIGA